jgi:TetR/AcrR family transcriptional regulator
MARPKTDDPEARANIMAAAEELFAARGFAGTSIRDIAQKAGVTGAMLHYYFGNKEKLYSALLEKAVARIRSLISETAASQKPVPEQLAQFIAADANYILSHANLTRIVLREMLAGGKEITKIFRQYRVNNYAMLRAIMAEGERRNELRQMDIALAPISLMGMLMVFQAFRPVISIALNRTEYDEDFIKRVAAHTTDLFLHGALNQSAATEVVQPEPATKTGAAKKAKKAGALPHARVKTKTSAKTAKKVKP